MQRSRESVHQQKQMVTIEGRLSPRARKGDNVGVPLCHMVHALTENQYGLVRAIASTTNCVWNRGTSRFA